MIQIPINLTPKSMPFYLTKFYLKEIVYESFGEQKSLPIPYQFDLYTELQKSHKIQFPQKEKPDKKSENSSAHLSIKIKRRKDSYAC